MPSSDPATRLQDIVDHIQAAHSFVSGISLEDFSKDPMRLFAAIRALEVISEASRRLPNEMKQRRSEIDWAAVAAAGNIYRHEYDVVDPRRIWRTIQNDLGELERVCAEELRGLT